MGREPVRYPKLFATHYFIQLGPAWHRRVIFTDQDLLKAFGTVENSLELKDKSVHPKASISTSGIPSLLVLCVRLDPTWVPGVGKLTDWVT